MARWAAMCMCHVECGMCMSKIGRFVDGEVGAGRARRPRVRALAVGAMPAHPHARRLLSGGHPPMCMCTCHVECACACPPTHLLSTHPPTRPSFACGGQVSIQILENVRNADVYIIQPTCPPVNDNLMELLLCTSAVRRAAAAHVTAIVPYYGYARQDRKERSRVPISAADVAKMMEAMGIDRVCCVDLHCGQIQGFFGPRTPVDNLCAGVASPWPPAARLPPAACGACAAARANTRLRATHGRAPAHAVCRRPVTTATRRRLRSRTSRRRSCRTWWWSPPTRGASPVPRCSVRASRPAGCAPRSR